MRASSPCFFFVQKRLPTCPSVTQTRPPQPGSVGPDICVRCAADDTAREHASEGDACTGCVSTLRPAKCCPSAVSPALAARTRRCRQRVLQAHPTDTVCAATQRRRGLLSAQRDEGTCEAPRFAAAGAPSLPRAVQDGASRPRGCVAGAGRVPLAALRFRWRARVSGLGFGHASPAAAKPPRFGSRRRARNAAVVCTHCHRTHLFGRAVARRVREPPLRQP